MSCGFRSYLELSVAHAGGERGAAAQAALRLPQLNLRPAAIAGKLDDKTVSIIAQLYARWLKPVKDEPVVKQPTRLRTDEPGVRFNDKFSRYRGVHWSNLKRTWVAKVTINKRQVYLGSGDEIHCARLVNAKYAELGMLSRCYPVEERRAA